MSKIEKAVKLLGLEVTAELEAMDADALQKRIVQANEVMRQVDEELEANEKYQEIKESLKVLTSGKREVNAWQKATISVALSVLNGGGSETK